MSLDPTVESCFSPGNTILDDVSLLQYISRNLYIYHSGHLSPAASLYSLSREQRQTAIAAHEFKAAVSVHDTAMLVELACARQQLKTEREDRTRNNKEACEAMYEILKSLRDIKICLNPGMRRNVTEKVHWTSGLWIDRANHLLDGLIYGIRGALPPTKSKDKELK